MNYTEEQKKLFGENVCIRREMLGMTKDELAEAYGCGRTAVSCWERGANVPKPNKIKTLARILQCSAHELFRPYRIPKISFIEERIIEKKEEPVMCDTDMIKAASQVFKNSYIEDTSNIEKKEHPVVARINSYMTDNDISQSELSRRTGIPLSTFNRVVHGALIYDNPTYARVEAYLDELEADNSNNYVENIDEVKTTEEEKSQEEKSEKKGSISDRFNELYEVLFAALAELDELKADITKIEKVTAMIKEIQL